MTIIHDADARGPGTHALVIGVGKYRHLRGGEMPRKQNLGLGQIKSPPISAMAFADWLLSEHQNPAAPAGSVELLLSPAQSYQLSSGQSIYIESATMANVEAAFFRWYEHCTAHNDNVAIFYFCGHGVKKTDLFLLPRGFRRQSSPAFP